MLSLWCWHQHWKFSPEIINKVLKKMNELATKVSTKLKYWHSMLWLMVAAILFSPVMKACLINIHIHVVHTDDTANNWLRPASGDLVNWRPFDPIWPWKFYCVFPVCSWSTRQKKNKLKSYDNGRLKTAGWKQRHILQQNYNTEKQVNIRMYRLISSNKSHGKLTRYINQFLE